MWLLVLYIQADYQCNDETYTKHIEYGGKSLDVMNDHAKKRLIKNWLSL